MQTVKTILKFLRALLITLAVIYGLGVMLLTLPPVQRHLSVAIGKELSQLLHTRASIGHLTVGYPNRLILDNVELEDLQGSPMLQAARLSVKFEWIPLLRDGRISIHTAQVFGLHAHLNRPHHEEPTNLQFLIDAFASEDSTNDSHIDLRINSLLVRRCHLRYDVLSEAETPGQFNPHHLSADNINATLSLKAFSHDSINAQVKRLDLTEQSGFRLEGMQMHLLANIHSIQLREFDMRLPESRIRFDSFHLTFPHEEGASDTTTARHPQFNIDGKMGKSYLTPADLTPFVPALRHFHDAIHLSASVKGDLQGLEIPTLKAYTQERWLDMEIDQAALHFPTTPAEQPRVNASITRLQLTPEGIPALWHNLKGTAEELPEWLQNLHHLHFNGHIGGTLNDLSTQGELATGIGSIVANAHVGTPADSTLTCQGHITSDSLDMKKLLGHEQPLGKVAFNLDFQGDQSPQKPASLHLKGAIPTLQYSDYTYQNIQLNGRFRKNTFDGVVGLEDPNVGLQVDGHFGISRRIPTFDLTARLEHFRPHDLKLTDKREGHEYAGILKAHFTGNNPDNITGSIHIDSLWAYLPRDTFFMPQLAIRAETSEEGKRVTTVKSEAIEAHIEGEYTYETLPTSFVQILKRYLPSLVGTTPPHVRKADNEFTFDLKLADSKFYPYVLDIPLKISPAATLHGFISNKQERVELVGDVPYLTYGEDEYEIGKIRCNNSPERIAATFSIAKHVGEDARVSLMIDAQAKNDSLNTTLTWGNDSRITYAGNIETETLFNKETENSPYLQAEVRIKPSEIIINDTVWDVNTSIIRLDSGFVDIKGLGVSHEEQHLSINGRLTDKETDSLIIDLNRIAAEYILDIVQFDAVDFSGQATGKIHINGALGNNMQAHTDLRVEDFHFNHGLMGDMDVSARWDNEMGIVLEADIREADTLAQTHVIGFVSPQQKGLDLNINTRNTNLAFLNSFIGGIFADVSGRATGPIRLHGPFKALNLEGKAIASASLKPRILNTPFRIENDSVILTTEAISLPHATAFDIDGNPIRLSGKLTHTNLKNMGYDFNLNLDRACFYHTTEYGDMPFYGKIYGSGNAHLYGGGNELHLSGDIRTEQGTTFYYNMSAPTSLTDNNFITFIDRTPRPQQIVVDNLKLFQRTQEEGEEDSSPLQVDITARIDATPNANIVVLMDSHSNDNISAYGSGDITIHYTNESTTLNGEYTIESGYYDMSIENLIQKRFHLQSGSTVKFPDNGGEAELDLKAIHTVNSVLLSDLVPEATFNQNSVKVDCIIKMSGKLNAPVPDFDLELPTINDEEKQLVRSAISTDEQIRTQILYLLLLGKFYTFDYANVEGQESSDLMSSLLSSTLSGQLNNLLSQALNMNNWNISSNLSTGREGWKNLEVEGILSGRLLNNRLIINGNFGYRENEMRNSNFIGDFNAQLRLNATGDFALKAYNMTNDRYFAKQTFNTQGVGLIYKREFDNWRDFFKRKK